MLLNFIGNAQNDIYSMTKCLTIYEATKTVLIDSHLIAAMKIFVLT